MSYIASVLVRTTILIGGLAAFPGGAPAVSIILNQTVAAGIQANGSITVPGALTLSRAGTFFTPYTGSMTLQYRARTSGSGSGNLTVRVIQDFPAGGPSAAAGDLQYSCAGATLGSACGSTTASASATAVVAIPSSACTGGGAPCSATDPNSVTVTFSIGDSPAIKTGTFNSVIQFTISAT